MSDKINLTEMLKEVLDEADRQGLRDNYLFVATFADYQQLRKIMAALKKEIDKGVVVNGKINPAIAEYNATAKSSANVAKNLKEMIYGASAVTTKQNTKVDVEQKVCPDFASLSTKEILKWCKKFDIDPDDYAKKFLFKALEKRWKFEYE